MIVPKYMISTDTAENTRYGCAMTCSRYLNKAEKQYAARNKSIIYVEVSSA